MSSYPECCRGHGCDRCWVCQSGVCCLTDVGQRLKAHVGHTSDSSGPAVPLNHDVGAHDRLVAGTARILDSISAREAAAPPPAGVADSLRAAIELGVVELRSVLDSSVGIDVTTGGSSGRASQRFGSIDANPGCRTPWVSAAPGLASGTPSDWAHRLDGGTRAEHAHRHRTPRPTGSHEKGRKTNEQ